MIAFTRKSTLLADSDVIELIEAAVLAEREACAKVCDERAAMAEARGYTCKGETFIDGWGDASGDCAAAIRARGE